jgi:hypothetical protein
MREVPGREPGRDFRYPHDRSRQTNSESQCQLHRRPGSERQRANCGRKIPNRQSMVPVLRHLKLVVGRTSAGLGVGNQDVDGVADSQGPVVELVLKAVLAPEPGDRDARV